MPSDHAAKHVKAIPSNRALPQEALIAIAKASRPQREPDARDDLPNPSRPKPIPARDADYYSPWG